MNLDKQKIQLGMKSNQVGAVQWGKVCRDVVILRQPLGKVASLPKPHVVGARISAQEAARRIAEKFGRTLSVLAD